MKKLNKKNITYILVLIIAVCVAFALLGKNSLKIKKNTKAKVKKEQFVRPVPKIEKKFTAKKTNGIKTSNKNILAARANSYKGKNHPFNANFKSTSKRSTNEYIALKGFIGTKAILSVNNFTSIARAGESIKDVKVLKVDPQEMKIVVLYKNKKLTKTIQKKSKHNIISKI